MYAETAYVMVGHGNEIVNKSGIKNIVPPGCTLVVEVHSGELNYLVDFNKIIKYNNKKIFLDPINNYKELVTNFSNTKKTFAIYKEGSEYPDFFYSLLSKWDDSDNMKSIKDSGIIKYPFNEIKPNHILPKYEIYNTYESSDILIDKYRMSIYPSKQNIYNFIVNNKLNTLDDVFNDKLIFSEFNKMILVKQSKLFKILGPGVYYNFVCRATTDNVIENADIIISSKGIENKHTFKVIKNNLRAPIKYRNKGNNYFIPEIIEQISEAEIHRKPYINKLELNKSDKQLEIKISLLKEDIKVKETIIKEHEKLINEYKQNIIDLENTINKYNNQIDIDKKLYAESNDKKISYILLEKINNNKQHIISSKHYIKVYKEYIADWINKISNTKIDISLLNDKIKKQSVLLSNPVLNKSINNYIWEKQNKKWGKVTIKNRNNKGKLPEGWKMYSTNTEHWYESPSGTLQWTRPQITFMTSDKKGPLPEGWVLESDGNAQWYKAPSGALQWTRPQIIIKNSNKNGSLPEGWVLESDGNAQWYKGPSGTLKWNRPIPEIQDPTIPNRNNSPKEENNPKPINIDNIPKSIIIDNTPRSIIKDNTPKPIIKGNNNSVFLAHKLKYESLLKQKQKNNLLLKTRKKKTFTEMIKGFFGYK